MSDTIVQAPVLRGKIDIPEMRKALEEAGVVEVRYYHRYLEINANRKRIKTWRTICDLFSGDNTVFVSTGLVRCSKKDQFCRRTGRIIALRRAINALDLKGRRQCDD
jgi:hypothetical protein